MQSFRVKGRLLRHQRFQELCPLWQWRYLFHWNCPVPWKQLSWNYLFLMEKLQNLWNEILWIGKNQPVLFLRIVKVQPLLDQKIVKILLFLNQRKPEPDRHFPSGKVPERKYPHWNFYFQKIQPQKFHLRK